MEDVKLINIALSVATIIFSVGSSWGVIRTTINYIKAEIAELKAWRDNHILEHKKAELAAETKRKDEEKERTRMAEVEAERLRQDAMWKGEMQSMIKVIYEKIK